MDIEISKVGNNFEVTKMFTSSHIEIKNYDKHTELQFQNNQIQSANRVGSNQLLIAIKDDYPHIIAKDPLLKVHVNYEKKINTFTEKPTTKTKVLHKPILVDDIKEEVNIPIDPNLIKEEIKQQVKEELKKEMFNSSNINTNKSIEIVEDIEVTPELSVRDKIEKIRKLLRHVIKSEIQHGFLLCGTSGIGKSFLVEELLEDEFQYRRDLHYISYKGSMSEAGLFTVIRKNPSKILILDDCDSVWGNSNTLNMLKGGLDSTVPKINKKKYIFECKYIIVDSSLDSNESPETYSIYIDDAHTEEECRTLFNRRVKYLSSSEDKNDEEIIYEIVEINKIDAEFIKPKRYVSKITTKKKQDIPIEFKGKIIFVSNWELDQFDVNLRNRIKMCPLSLDRKEVVYYIKSLSHKLMPQIKDLDVKNMVLNYYLDHPELPLDIRTFVNTVDLAVTSPEYWTELLNT